SNIDLYIKTLENLSLTVKKRLIHSLDIRSGGIIVKTNHYLTKIDDNNVHKMLDKIIFLFHINVIFIMDNELVSNFIKTKYSKLIKSQLLNVELIPRVPGVI